MNRLEAIGLARSVAVKFAVPVALFCGLIEQESNYDNWAIRFEPAFLKKYVEPLGLPATETYARSTSWGPGQVMGQVAREMGYKGPLPQLCEWEIGLAMAAGKLKKELSKAAGDERKALLGYNGGANLSYPDEVLTKAKQYEVTA